MAAQPRQEIGHVFVRLRQDQRSAGPAGRAAISASRHSGECHRKCPRPCRRWRRAGSRRSGPPVVCATILGTPVVPEVNSTHSVLRDGAIASPGVAAGAAARTARRPPPAPDLAHHHVDARRVRSRTADVPAFTSGGADHHAAPPRRPARSAPGRRTTGRTCAAAHCAPDRSASSARPQCRPARTPCPRPISAATAAQAAAPQAVRPRRHLDRI